MSIYIFIPYEMRSFHLGVNDKEANHRRTIALIGTHTSNKIYSRVRDSGRELVH